MIRVFSFCILLAFSINGYADVIGWHWYNLPAQKERSDERIVHMFKALPASDQLKILQKATKELRDKAVLSGKVVDITAYKRAQDYWVNKATMFAVGWERMLLGNPSLDYSLKHTHENTMIAADNTLISDKKNKAIKNLAKHDGLLMFYRKNNSEDKMFAKAVDSYCTGKGITHIKIDITSNKRNAQKAKLLGVTYFPALVLVDPINNKHQVVDYGYKSESELNDRLYKIITKWKPEF
ncbi:MAG: conjugal transfer protein TraF [Candidatus Thioglobus sp.]